MRKIKLNLCTTLDGFIEGAHGEIDWCYTDQDYGMTVFLESIDTIFVGRKSYQQLKHMDPEAFSDKKMIVFTKQSESEYGDAQMGVDILKEVNEFKNTKGKDIWLFGGSELVNALLELDLIDEMLIAVHPVILGGGKPLFSNITDRKEFKLKEVKTYSSGLVQQHYTLE